MGRALVLGGGGVTGIAWELGVIAGLHAGGVDVRGADLVVGTSAGAAVAAQITSGEPLEALVERQRTPASESKEIMAELDPGLLTTIFASLFDPDLAPDDRRAAVGAAALAADTVPEAVRLDTIAARLPRTTWPDRAEHHVVLTAVDAVSGAFVTFDGADGVTLLDAVAASCAVPGIWPPTTIGDRRFMDGGVRSSTNADLAAGNDRVLVLTPMDPALLGAQVEDEVAGLEAAGSQVVVVQADPEALAAMGDNALDPAYRGPAVDAGLRQGGVAVELVRAMWRGAATS